LVAGVLAVDQAVEDAAGVLLGDLGVDRDAGERGGHEVGRLPGVHDVDAGVAQAALLERPLQGATGAVGVVDADHDPPARRFPGCGVGLGCGIRRPR
jgi:hypothetical protein